MKKNTILYILLIFLVVVNAFFLFNYLGETNQRSTKEPQKDRDFIVNELGFNESQLAQFRENSKDHHESMMNLSDDIKNLKDELFSNLTGDVVKDEIIDSLASLICDKEKQKDKEVFSHFKMIQELSNEKQKEKFKTIIMDALRRGDPGNRPPPDGKDGQRPPPRDRESHRPPPRDN